MVEAATRGLGLDAACGGLPPCDEHIGKSKKEIEEKLNRKKEDEGILPPKIPRLHSKRLQRPPHL
jgi:hypothetical protein